MRFLYATDLHGDPDKYEALLTYAVGNAIPYIHIGADILPKGPGLMRVQKKFVKGYLKEFYKKCADKRIQVFAMFGNDDVYTRKKYFKEYGKLVDETPETIEGFILTGYPYVPDYPFPLVTACKYDYKGWEPELYFGRKLDVDEKDFVEILNKQDYFRKKGTIKEDLDLIHADYKTVIAIHTPPCGLGLDVCFPYTKVGSRSVYEWIEREQPRLVLCGHIHESRYLTGTWKAQIGKSTILQPGQSEDEGTYAVEVDLKDTGDEYKLLKL